MFHKTPIVYIFFAAVFAMPLSAFAGTPGVGKSFVSTIGTNTATISGTAGSDYPVDTVRWFEWGASPDTPLSNATARIRNGMRWEGFDETIGNLSPDTAYFFRVAAQNGSGTVYGKVVGFKTTRANAAPSASEIPVPAPYVAPVPVYYNNPNIAGVNTNSISVPQIVVTNIATDISNTGARMNATALPGGATEAVGWFLWGTTPNLNNASTKLFLGAGASLPFSAMLSGLTPGTTYFFKPVIQSTGGTSEGALFRFHTTGASPAVISSIVSPIVASGNVKTRASSAVAVSPGAKVLKKEVVPGNDTAATKENLAAASAAKITSSFFPLTLKSWGVIIGFLFLLFAAYLVFFITRRKKSDEEIDETTDETILPIIPVKKAVTEKGMPPENLPV